MYAQVHWQAFLVLVIAARMVYSEDPPRHDNLNSSTNISAQEFGTTGLSEDELRYWKQRSQEVIGSEDLQSQLSYELMDKFNHSNEPEIIRMLKAVLDGSDIGASDGWFGAGASLYDWNWLCKKFESSNNDGISKSELVGFEHYFDVLDRDGNGFIQAKDLDWSADSDWVKRAGVLNQLFRSIDGDGDNRADRQELLNFFDTIKGNESEFSSQGLRDFVLRGRASYVAGDAPTPDRLLQGLFNNEVGSVHQGPNIGDKAPLFELSTQDGAGEVVFEKTIGEQPVVLVFGNFTCGPFRRNFPEVEDIYQRYRDKAKFIGIYVREAHPTDGWIMSSNTDRGVRFAQPRTYADRVAIASVCHASLNYTMPLLVDSIEDEVGNAYSGMPARMYVIDTNGNVTYKGGRGPYGFKVGEMEQALVLTLLDGVTK